MGGWDTRQDLIKCWNKVKLRLCIIVEEEPGPLDICENNKGNYKTCKLTIDHSIWWYTREAYSNVITRFWGLFNGEKQQPKKHNLKVENHVLFGGNF